MKVAGFDWDNGNIAKCQKHGLSIEDIEFCFTHGHYKLNEDPQHSITEDRYFIISKTQNNRYCFVVFTYRVKNRQKLIRPLSARYMHKKEIKNYEEKTT